MLVYSKVWRKLTFSISFRWGNFIIYLSFVWEKCFASQRIDTSFHEAHQPMRNVFHVHMLTFFMQLCNRDEQHYINKWNRVYIGATIESRCGSHSNNRTKIYNALKSEIPCPLSHFYWIYIHKSMFVVKGKYESKPIYGFKLKPYFGDLPTNINDRVPQLTPISNVAPMCPTIGFRSLK